MVAKTEKRRPSSVESAGHMEAVIAATGARVDGGDSSQTQSVRRLVHGGKGDLWIANEVREIMGQVRRPKQPGPAAVEVVELPRPRPRPKEGGGGELASVHAIAEESLRRPKTKTETETKTEEADAEQATHRQEEESRWPWAADAKAASAVQGQVDELARMVEGLKKQRISTDREIKHHRAWVEAELKERAMAAQVQQVEERMGKISVDVRDLGVWQCRMMPLADMEWIFADMQRVLGRLGQMQRLENWAIEWGYHRQAMMRV